MKTRRLFLALTFISLLAKSPAVARVEQPDAQNKRSESPHKQSQRHKHGGYYESIRDPDFGSNIDRDSNYRAGDGYYGYLTPGHAGLLKPEEEMSAPIPPAPHLDVESQAAPTPPATQTLAPPAIPTATQTLTPPAMPMATTKLVIAPTAPRKLSLQELMNQGRDEFRQSAFHAATDSFEQATEKNPLDQDAHFWLGMAYWKLYDYENAKSQLEIAFRLNPFNTEGQAAKAQILKLAPYLGAQQTPPVDPVNMVRQTIATTHEQAGSLQEQKFLDGYATAQRRIASAQLQAEKIQRETNDYLRSARWHGHHYGYQPSNLQEVSDLAYIRSHYALTDGYREAALANLDAAHRATNVQDWENHLLRQLGRTARPGQPRLRAFGTNLYTQYYGDEDPGNPRQVPPADLPLQAKALVYTPRVGNSHLVRSTASSKKDPALPSN